MRFLIALLLVLLVGCRPPENTGRGAADTPSDVRVRLEAPGNPTVGPADVRVYLLGADNEAVTDATVTVTGTMTHAGMEPVISDTAAPEDGLYTTEDFTFTMAGDWLLQAEANLPDGSSATGELPLTVTEN
jgi:hypothetical protein